MSQSINRYDRDHNIDGPILPFTFVPEYGSKVSFENKNVHFYTADNYYKKFSKGVNGASIKFNLKFSNKTEDEARSFLYFLENAIDYGGNYFDFNSPNSSGVEITFPTGSIYKNISELYVESYDFKFHNGLFDIDLNLKKDSYSSLFDWKGSSYLNVENFYTGWESGINYEKFDVVYYSGYKEQGSNYFYTGHFHRIVDRRDNFYYCPSGHTSEQINNPIGINSAWSKSFFYEIDDDISIGSDRSNDITKLKDSFSFFNKKNQNDGLIRNLSLSFKNRSNKEVRSIIHFLEKHEDYRPFELTLPQLYNKKKFFVVKSFDHKFVYKDCNDIELTLDEVFLFKKADIFDNYETTIDPEFSMTIETQFNNQTIQISGENEDGNYIMIGWGDGTINLITGRNDPLLTHIYPNTGVYDINISGYIPNVTLPINNHKLLVSSINGLGDIGWTSLSGAFTGFLNMTSFTAGITDISLVNSMESMFSGLYQLRSTNFDSLDTSSVTNMEKMFYGCTNLGQLNISSFDTSSVTDMQYMFYDCDDLTDLDLSSFDTSSVTDMNSMFSDCVNLTALDLSSFDTSLVTNMRNMFYNCQDLTGLDVSGFDTSLVTDMQYMFYNCVNLTGLDVSSFDTSLVTDMQYMFYNCDDLTSLNVSSFDTSLVTNMRRMFYNCQDLTGLDVSSFDTSLVTNMQYMFYNCVNLTDIIGVNNFNIESIQNIYNLNSFAGFVTLPTARYDSLLINWNNQNIINEIIVDFGLSKYSSGSQANAARINLTDVRLWSINDGGPV